MPSMLTKESFMSEGVSSTMEGDDLTRSIPTPPTTPTSLGGASNSISTKEFRINEKFSEPVDDEPMKTSRTLTSSTYIKTNESCIHDKFSYLVDDKPMATSLLPASSTGFSTKQTFINDKSALPMDEDCMTQDLATISVISTKDNFIYDHLLLPEEDEYLKGRLTPPLPPNTLPKPSEDLNINVKSTSESLQISNHIDLNLHNEGLSMEQLSSENIPSLQSINRIEETLNSSSSLTFIPLSTTQEIQVHSREASSIGKDDIPIICATYYDNLPEPNEEVHSIQSKEQISTSDLTEKLNKLQVSPDTDHLKTPEETFIDPDKPPKKRASSLKLTKTPPDQKQKKIVKFADVFGLDIADVREFMKGIPDIPKSAFSDLTGTQIDMPNIMPKKCLSTRFKDPCDSSDFWERVLKQKVCVERVMIGDDLSIRGVIRVLNLAFDKKVFIKYTFDKWKTHHESTATYLAASNDGVTDQFSFLLWGNFLKDKGVLLFVVRYETLGQDYWDNNKDNNYKLHCVESLPGTPIASTMALEKSEKTRSNTTLTKKSHTRQSRNFSMSKPKSRQSLIDSLNNEDLDDILQRKELIVNNKEPDLLLDKEDITMPNKSAVIPVPGADSKYIMSSFRIDSSPADLCDFRFY